MWVSHHEPPPLRTRPRRRTIWPDYTAAGRATTPPRDSDDHHHGHVLPPGHVSRMKSCHDSKLGSYVSPRGNPLKRGSRRPTPSPRFVGPHATCTGGPYEDRTGWPTRVCLPRGDSPTNGSTSVACRRPRPRVRRRPPRRTPCPCAGVPRELPQLGVPRGSAGASAGPPAKTAAAMVSASIRSRGMARVILEKRSTMTKRCSFPAAVRGRGPSRSMHKSVCGSVGGNVLR